METVNQNKYLINQMSSSTYGEWPGITPCKWRGSIKIIRPLTSGDTQSKYLL